MKKPSNNCKACINKTHGVKTRKMVKHTCICGGDSGHIGEELFVDSEYELKRTCDVIYKLVSNNVFTLEHALKAYKVTLDVYNLYLKTKIGEEAYKEDLDELDKPEVKFKLKCNVIKLCVEDNTFTLEEALNIYGITEEDYDNYLKNENMLKDIENQEKLVTSLYELVNEHADISKCNSTSVSLDGKTTFINTEAMSKTIKDILKIFDKEHIKID